MTFRSKEMEHIQMIVPRESAYETVNKLGQENLLHLIDNGNLLDRPFTQMIKRCDDCLQKVGVMTEALQSAKIEIQEYDENEPLFVEKLHAIWKEESKDLAIDEAKLIDVYEEQVCNEYNRFCDLTSRIDKITQSNISVMERIACLETISSFFGESAFKRNSQDYYLNNAAEGHQMSGVSFIVGVIEKANELRLSRMIYRVSRGYAVAKILEDFKFSGLSNFTEEVVLVIYPTSDTTVLERKLKKVMDTFCKSNYIMTELDNPAEQKLKYEAAIAEFHETSNLIVIAKKEMKRLLNDVKNLECVDKWRIYFWKEKALYETLNKMDSRDQFYIANFYIPTDSVRKLYSIVGTITPSPNPHSIAIGKPPTAFNSNSYTASPQLITDTYGVPRYQQINPSIFTTVTFPFFFGVMFGDIGHGLILFCIGLYLVFKDEEIRKGSLKMFSGLRYMIVMMGFFAVYCGFIYNDVIGFNVNLFGSCYDPPAHPSEEDERVGMPIYPRDPDCVYPMGIDPVWGRAENNLVFVNSLKMKLSVIIAIIHMTLGVCCKAANAIFYKDKLVLYYEFIPQFIFLVGLFGYMDFLIIFKWLKPWDTWYDNKTPPQQWAPSIITTMMNIGLAPGHTQPTPTGGSAMWGTPGESSQDALHLILLGVAFVCIPWMLLPKPIIEIKKMNRVKRVDPLASEEEIDEEHSLKQKLNASSEKSLEDEEAHGDSSEIFVHQLIETIEFVLGAISNTASYLRLWALSLAHSQLSQVFWNKTAGLMLGSMQLLQLPMLFMGFFLVCWITFGLIICMDSMECFLHSLRLHWVEFQNKFYKGDGYAYQPLYFKTIILDKKSVSIL